MNIVCADLDLGVGLANAGLQRLFNTHDYS